MSRFFGDAIHSAYVVPDLDAAIDRMLATGIGPAFVMRRLRGPGLYRGERHDSLMSVAFLCSGDAVIELLAPHDDVPSSYNEYLARHPDGGLHHIAYMSADFDATMRQAKAAGMEFRRVQEYIDGETGTPFEIYIEPVGADDPVLAQLILPGLFDSWFAAMKDIAAHWDGSDPIRDGALLLPAEMRPVSEPA